MAAKLQPGEWVRHPALDIVGRVATADIRYHPQSVEVDYLTFRWRYRGPGRGPDAYIKDYFITCRRFGRGFLDRATPEQIAQVEEAWCLYELTK